MRQTGACNEANRCTCFCRLHLGNEKKRCFFLHFARFALPLRRELEGRLHLGNEKKRCFFLHFARFALPLQVVTTYLYSWKKTN
jgi:hypothetical protein